MENVHTYRTDVTWTGGRSGRLEAEGLPTLRTGPPPEFGGEAGNWTPEHLFVAAATSCLMATFLAVAAFSKLEVSSYVSRASGTVEKVEDQGWMFGGLEIEVDLKVPAEADVVRALKLMRKAEQSCLVAKSMRAPVKVRVTVEAAESGTSLLAGAREDPTATRARPGSRGMPRDPTPQGAPAPPSRRPPPRARGRRAASPGDGSGPGARRPGGARR
jgi:organic hydroperoxide reductase OsmC/OhrA